MQDDYNASARLLNPIPWVVWVVVLPIIAFEIVFGLASLGFVGGVTGDSWRLDAIQRFAFFPDLFFYYLKTGNLAGEMFYRFITYSFVHGSIVHALFAVALLLAFGKMIGELFSWWAFLIIFFGSATLAAISFSFIFPQSDQPLFGAYPAIYALVGGFTYIKWLDLGSIGAPRYGAFRLIAFLVGAQLLFSALFGGGLIWVSDVLGFAYGYLLSFIVFPGGVQKIIQKIRNRD